MDERLDEVVQEIIEEQALGRVSGAKVFRSMLNQPDMIAVSSANGITEAVIPGALGSASFYNFTCNLPRPALDVESVQLVSANIPQAQSNIPDTACVFWYYKCSEYSGKKPNINNLLYNRLLPSTYKQELIPSPTTYGWNRTFKNYRDLATELLSAGVTDLCWYNWTRDTQASSDGDYVPYIPNDASITLNTEMNKFQMTGANVYVPPSFITWVGGDTYALGDRVKYLGISYISLAAANTGNNPTTSPLKWRQDYNEIMADWDADTNYGLGRYVTKNGKVYVCSFPNASQDPFSIYDWTYNAARVYTIGQVVISGGVFWSWMDTNRPQANTPPGPPNWFATLWNGGQFYPLKFTCLYNDVFYTCIVANQGNTPATSPAFWTPIVFWTEIDMTETTRIWNRYLITGYADPNVAQAQGNEFEYEWNANYLYEQGEVVNYRGNTYEAYTQNIGTPPLDAWTPTQTYALLDQVLYTGGASPQYYQSLQANNTNHLPSTSTTWWVPIRTEWINTTSSPLSAGLNYLTSVYDMMGTNGTTEITFPPAIAGQPFNPTPARILNSILGFSWNGTFSITGLPDFPTYPTSIITNFQLLQDTGLINRFRPVPFYQIRPNWSSSFVYPKNYVVLASNGQPYFSRRNNNLNHDPISSPTWWTLELSGGLGAVVLQNAASTTGVFTADAYANLVYSSIVYIYTSIVGGSTLDTSRNTNLLAVTPMNAGNLGVAFSNQFVDNPLTKVFGDINSLYVELRDEFGEPYLLSNNAVVTFTLKVKFLQEFLPRNNT